MKKKNIIILGSTGSIGQSALDVVRHHREAFQVVGLAAHRNIGLMIKQIKEFSPRMVAIDHTPSANELKRLMTKWKKPPTLFNQRDGLEKLAASPQVDFVLSGVVGFRGLLPLMAALKAGKTVGLANKEALVVAGDLINRLAKKYGGKIIPVDSEHSAMFQCLKGHEGSRVERLILTASGGPFYRYKDDLNKITVEEALNHPTWKMGHKITVDSATLMNKGLEAIEAHHLFQVPLDRIDILIHPQSIVHSLVEFEDGSALAQMSHPDMRIPIQYAMTYPGREKTKVKKLHLAETGRLDFAKPDFSRFPCLNLALQAGRKGGTAPAALSAANEIAVRAFLDRQISFMMIPQIVKRVVEKHSFSPTPGLEQIIQVDERARREAAEWVEKLNKGNKKQ